MEMMNTYKVRVSIAVALTLLCLPLFASSKSENASSLYQKALKMETDLKNSDKLKNDLSYWKNVVSAFRSVYYNYPSSGYCDNSLFHVASLYSEMGDRFSDSLYYHRACSSFEFLIEQYSSSSLAQDAMLEYIRISRIVLKKETDARNMEARLKTRYPKTFIAMQQKGKKDEGRGTVGNGTKDEGRGTMQVATSLVPRPSSPSSMPAMMTRLRHYTGTDYTRIVIDFNQEVSFKRNRLANPDRLYFDFDNTIAEKSLLTQSFSVDDGFLKQIRVGQNTLRRARVVLDLKSIENYDVFPLYHPYRLIIDIQGKKSSAPVAAVPEEVPIIPPEMAKSNASGQYSLARQLGLKVQRIIVDPGHGGYDPGAMSRGLREKDITLDVSKRLRKILQEDYGFEVLMTREVDQYVALEERTAFANSHSADLFVSVHVNSSRNRSARGVETYYLNFATTPQAMEVAARENAIAGGSMAELQKLTAAIALNSKIAESRDFANLIQAKLTSRLQKDYSTSSLGVKQAPFYVLIGAQMPSVLAEISFLSNERESNLLSKDSYRQSVAEGIAQGVKGYIETLAESKLTQNRKK